MQKYGRFGTLRFYELDHDESKMRLLKTQSHTPTVWLWSQEHAQRKAVEGNADPTTRQKSPINNLPRAATVAEGAEKALEPATLRR